MADIFLSYAREDEPRARLLATALESHGWSVWWDRRIPHGSDFNQYIQEQLDAARCIVVLWSKASLASRFVRDEATEGLNDGRLVPLLLEAVRQPLGFRQLHAADLSDWNGRPPHDELDRLAGSIRVIVPPSLDARAVSPAPVPSAPQPNQADPPNETAPDVAATGPAFDPSVWNLPREALLGFVEIPAGPFTMGSDRGEDEQASDDELPQHQLTLPAFFMGRYEVTVGQFKACVNDGGCKPGNLKALDGPGDLPVRYVSWHEALAYCGWLESKLKKGNGIANQLAAPLGDALSGRRDKRPWHVTLPSEAEWERAARGTDGRIYPWGDSIDPTKANYDEADRGGPTPVGSFPTGASPEKLLDMSGNVWEWTRSHYKRYPYRPDDGRENLRAGDSVLRVVRGGAFHGLRRRVRAAYRRRRSPGSRFNRIGFRLVVSPFSSDL
jgi:formylglycine-generating enzyme required for sulfatase activity